VVEARLKAARLGRRRRHLRACACGAWGSQACGVSGWTRQRVRG
jgi:hypothetical protein